MITIIITVEEHPGLTYHFHSNTYIGNVEMIDEITVLTPIIHHFHSNAYIGTVEMIGDNTVLTPIIHHFHINAYIGTVEMIGDNSIFNQTCSNPKKMTFPLLSVIRQRLY